MGSKISIHLINIVFLIEKTMGSKISIHLINSSEKKKICHVEKIQNII